MGGVEAAPEPLKGRGADIRQDDAVVRSVQRRQEREPGSAKPSDRGQVHPSVARDTAVTLADVDNVRFGREEHGLGEEPEACLGVRGALSKLVVGPVLEDAAPDDDDVVLRSYLFSEAEVPHEEPFRLEFQSGPSVLTRATPVTRPGDARDDPRAALAETSSPDLRESASHVVDHARAGRARGGAA